MSKFKPGEFRITEQAMANWQLPKGAEILDIGCGEGDTLAYLEKKYGYKGCGIDLSPLRIEEGKAKNPSLNLKCGDGEFLEDFVSFSFDGVLMECVLSVIDKPDEALHETYCVLKKGGKLFISDLYIKNPDQEFIESLEAAAEKAKMTPHEEGECDEKCSVDHKDRPINFRSDGRFLLPQLLIVLDEMGYQKVKWEDCSLELDQYVAEKLLADGTLAGCLCETAIHPIDSFKTGYFMLTAEKASDKNS